MRNAVRASARPKEGNDHITKFAQREPNSPVARLPARTNELLFSSGGRALPSSFVSADPRLSLPDEGGPRWNPLSDSCASRGRISISSIVSIKIPCGQGDDPSTMLSHSEDKERPPRLSWPSTSHLRTLFLHNLFPIKTLVLGYTRFSAFPLPPQVRAPSSS